MAEPRDEAPRVARLRVAREAASRMLADDAATRLLGIEISDVAPGRATARMTVRESMVNGHGMAHGGYLFLLADSAFAFACNTHGHPAVARGADVVFVAPAHRGDTLIATAVERTTYGSSGITDVTVRREDDGALLAEFRGQSAVLRRPRQDREETTREQ